MKELQNRAIRAAKRFAEHRGMEIVDEAPEEIESGFVAKDGSDLVFMEVSVSNSIDRGLPSQKSDDDTRRRRERQAAGWLARFDEKDVRVRFDSIALLVVGEDKALIRHHINCLGCE